jgi:hypothetical protein
MFIHTGLGDDENCDGTPVKRSASSTNNIIGYLKEKMLLYVYLRFFYVNINNTCQVVRIRMEYFLLAFRNSLGHAFNILCKYSCILKQKICNHMQKKIFICFLNFF